MSWLRTLLARLRLKPLSPLGGSDSRFDNVDAMARFGDRDADRDFEVDGASRIPPSWFKDDDGRPRH